MAKRNDLSAFKSESRGVLASVPTAAVGKGGRPKKEVSEKRSQRIVLSFTPAEEEIIKSKAGMIPLATFLMATLKESGVLD